VAVNEPKIDYPEVSKDYPFATVLPNPKPRRRLNYTTYFAIITLAIYIVSWIIFR
jgi:hypothetical protein